MRHPIYTGLLLLGVGLAIIGASWMHVALLVALVSLLSKRARLEEWMLLARFMAYAELVDERAPSPRAPPVMRASFSSSFPLIPP